MRTGCLRNASCRRRHVLREVADARFGLYAYHTTPEPPERVDVNRHINLSDVYNGLPYLYHLPAKRIAMEQQIRGWRRATGSVVLTTYYTFDGNYSLPWSGIDAQAWMIRLLAEFPGNSGVLMTFAQIDPAPMGMVGPNPSVLSELLWDPSKSPDALSVDFFKGAFGLKAGPLLRQYFDAINSAMVSAIARVPYRRAHSLREYVVPAYGSVRIQCQSSVEAAIVAVSRDAERFRWRVDRIARGWQLVEHTLATLAAEKAGDSADTKTFWAQRDFLLTAPGSRPAVAPASSDLLEDRALLRAGAN